MGGKDFSWLRMFISEINPKIPSNEKTRPAVFVDDWSGFSVSTLKGWLFLNSVEVDFPINMSCSLSGTLA